MGGPHLSPSPPTQATQQQRCQCQWQLMVCSNPHPQPTPHSNSWGVQLVWHPCRVLAPPDVRVQEPMQQLQPASAVHQVACSRQRPCHWQSLLCLPAAPSCFGIDHPATLCCQACQPYFTVQHSSCSPVPRPLRVPVHCLLSHSLARDTAFLQCQPRQWGLAQHFLKPVQSQQQTGLRCCGTEQSCLHISAQPLLLTWPYGQSDWSCVVPSGF